MRHKNSDNPALFDYRRYDYWLRRHHERLKAFIDRMPHKLVCQGCGDGGNYTEVLFDGMGPSYECGWCEGIGFVTPYIRGLWLKFHRTPRRVRTLAELLEGGKP